MHSASPSLDAAMVERSVAAAVAAPSIHNTQPWRFGLAPETLTLQVRAVPERGLRHTDPVSRTGHRADLYEAIWRRHSSRLPFSGRPLPSYLRNELGEAARVEGARLWFPDAAGTARLLRLTAEAERRNASTPTVPRRTAAGCTETWSPFPT
ncbi:hypothetical protein ALMP_40190 [Streptomyces sp. A012304]|nr:hypothetical protein ALMP_40190 [Streptomyces sp. A012304]